MKTAAYYVKTEGCQAFQTHMCINARSSHIAGDWLENLRQKPTWRRKTAFATIPKSVEMRDDSSSQGGDGTIRPPAVLLGTSKLSSHIARTRCTRGCLAKVVMAPQRTSTILTSQVEKQGGVVLENYQGRISSETCQGHE